MSNKPVRADDGTMWLRDSDGIWTGWMPGEDQGSTNILNTEDMRRTYPEVVARWEARR